MTILHDQRKEGMELVKKQGRVRQRNRLFRCPAPPHLDGGRPRDTTRGRGATAARGPAHSM